MSPQPQNKFAALRDDDEEEEEDEAEEPAKGDEPVSSFGMRGKVGGWGRHLDAGG